VRDLYGPAWLVAIELRAGGHLTDFGISAWFGRRNFVPAVKK
jgi:hypothetical protein